MIEIPVVFSFARSGGTLVNKMLGAHPDCLVLSEINPAASFKSLSEQAEEWLGLIGMEELPEFERLAYTDQILTLHERAARKNRLLIIRDWVTVNFLPECSRGISPSRQLEQLLYLQQAGVRVIPIVVSRKAFFVRESMKKVFPELANAVNNHFNEAYLQYAKAVSGLPVFHLEKLQQQPRVVLNDILQRFSLDGDHMEDVMNNFPDFASCTGNNTLNNPSETSHAYGIVKQQEKKDSIQCDEPLLAAADKALGYV